MAEGVDREWLKTNSGPRGARWGRLTANSPFDVGTDAKPRPQILLERLSSEQPILSRVELLAPLHKVALLPSLAVAKPDPTSQRVGLLVGTASQVYEF